MEIVKARCLFSLRFDTGHNFLSSSLICQLFTNPILRKNTQFKCKCNLRRGAASRLAVPVLQRGTQPKRRPAAVSLRSSQSLSLSFVLKPPASEPQLQGKGLEPPWPQVFQTEFAAPPGRLGVRGFPGAKPTAVSSKSQNRDQKKKSQYHWRAPHLR